jgi:hypothetical protein
MANSQRYSNSVMMICFSLLCTGLMTSCKKDAEGAKDKPDPVAPVIVTGVYTLRNLVADSAGTYSSGSKPFYYSLEEGKIIPASQAQTNNWDICFNSTYNSNVCANNGSIASSPGYGGPGKGSIYMVVNSGIDGQYYNAPGKPIKKVPVRALFDQAFAGVTNAAVADGKWESDAIVGLDYFQNTTPGWAWYDFYGELFPGKPTDSVAHVAYSLPRSLIVKTAKGNYAKIQIYSFYKDAPEVPTRSNKPGFITMKYAIQKNGSTNLDIKE